MNCSFSMSALSLVLSVRMPSFLRAAILPCHERLYLIPDKGKSSYPLMNNISISESGVTKLLQNINPHKATGPDEICGRVLKVLSATISRPLTLIFQKKHSKQEKYITTGNMQTFVQYLKRETNRPISLTCILSKIMEH